jgi:hypothetical protein
MIYRDLGPLESARSRIRKGKGSMLAWGVMQCGEIWSLCDQQGFMLPVVLGMRQPDRGRWDMDD